MAEVKKIKVENTEFEVKAIAKNYASLFLRVAKKAPVTGMTVDQMIEIKEFIDYLGKNIDKKELELYPSRIKNMIEKINNHGWIEFSEELVALIVYLRSL